MPAKGRFEGVLRRGILACALVVVSGCDLLPTDGPNANNVLAGAAERRKAEAAAMGRFALVGLDSRIASEVEQFYRPSLVSPPAAFQKVKAFGTVGVGDLLRLTLWEAPGSGLFSREGKNGAEVDLRVDADGTISVPYGGRIPAKGRTVGALEKAVEESLKTLTVDPHATILVAESISGSITVQGEVAKPGPVPLVRPGERILDAVALAGGAKFPPYETTVRITREGAAFDVGLQALIDHPDVYNLKLSGGDSILLIRTPHKFIALGAVGNPGAHFFTKSAPTLSDALGQVLGLESQRADAKAMYLFRKEPVELARRCGVMLEMDEHQRVPVVYQVDMKDPKSLFVLGVFPVESRDILYVSTAPLSDVGKFMQIVSGATSTVAIPRTLFGNFPGGP